MNGSHDHWQPTRSVLLVLQLRISKLTKHSENEDRIQLSQNRTLGSMKTETLQLAMFQFVSWSAKNQNTESICGTPICAQENCI